MDDLAEIMANEKDMEQMCFAIMENAIQAADGKKQHQLVITGEVVGRQVCLRFDDDCGGMLPEDVEKVFQPFFTTKPPGVGTGLGLCIVERIVTQARGKVYVENTPGRGLAICVNLPLEET
jgi:C4-dicarboxylate-specific signal transduction histidine kinase